MSEGDTTAGPKQHRVVIASVRTYLQPYPDGPGRRFAKCPFAAPDYIRPARRKKLGDRADHRPLGLREDCSRAPAKIRQAVRQLLVLLWIGTALLGCAPRGSAASGPTLGGPAQAQPPAAGAVSTVSATNASPPPRRGFYVDGRFLYDRCGERVVLRGVNEMIVWSDGRDGVPEFAEIAKTGANSVRIVWTTEGSAVELDRAIGNALAAKLIPIVELHDATGDFSKLGMLVDYWTRPDVLAVIGKHEHALLVNIGNEVGSHGVEAGTWEAGYLDAIGRLRGAGIAPPLIVDAPGWGQDIDRLQSSGPKLIAADPAHNVMLSVHMWWTDGTGERIRAELRESIALGLPLLVGEFGPYAVHECPKHAFDLAALLAEAQAQGIGWLPWSWGNVKNRDCPGYFDMTTDGTYAGLSGWGRAVAIDDPNSIRETSVRPWSVTHAGCREAQGR